MLAEYRQEETFAYSTMRQETVYREIASHQVARNVPFWQCIDRKYLGSKFIGYPCHIIFILLAVERTSAIYQESTRFQAVPNICQYAALTLPTQIYIPYTPLFYRSGILTKHSFARARHVGKNNIEQMAQRRKIVTCHHHIGVSPLYKILSQYLRAVTHHLVGYQQTALGQYRTS